MRFLSVVRLSMGGFILLSLLSLSLKAQVVSSGMTFKGFSLADQFDSLSVEQHKMLRKRGVYQKLTRYDLNDDHLENAGIPLKFVRVFFWKGYIHSMEIRASGLQGTPFREWIESMYGEGEQEDAMGYKFVWEYPAYRLLVEQNMLSKDVNMVLLHEEVHNSYYKFMYERQYGK